MKRLYAESNFVLELVFAQEQSEHCETLLRAAESGDLQLVLPAFCLGEPLETLGRRHRVRSDLHDRLQREIGQLRRVAEYADQLAEATAIEDLLTVSAQEDLGRLEVFYLRLAEAVELVPVTPDVIRRSFALRRDFDLSAQDAVVLSTVAIHLESAPGEATFVTKNAKDFDDPLIRAYLENRRCDLLTTFGQAVGVTLHGA